MVWGLAGGGGGGGGGQGRAEEKSLKSLDGAELCGAGLDECTRGGERARV